MNSPVVFQDKKRVCPAKLGRSRGFTLIEVLIVLGIVALIATLGVIANTRQYTREVSTSETAIIVSALQKARSRSMNNIGAMPHGVYFGDDPCPNTDYDFCYIIFRGEEFDDNPDSYEYAKKNPSVTLTSDFSGDEIYFKQVSGD